MNNISINSNGGFYTPGRSMTLERKLEVAEVYQKYLNSGTTNRSDRLNLSAIARETGLSEATVRKIEQEITYFGSVQQPKKCGTGASGPGSL